MFKIDTTINGLLLAGVMPAINNSAYSKQVSYITTSGGNSSVQFTVFIYASVSCRFRVDEYASESEDIVEFIYPYYYQGN